MSTIIFLTEALAGLAKTCRKQEEDIHVLTAANETLAGEHTELKALYERQFRNWLRVNDHLTDMNVKMHETHDAEIATLKAQIAQLQATAAPAPAPLSNAPELLQEQEQKRASITWADIAPKLNTGETIRVMYEATEYIATWDGTSVVSETLGNFKTASAWSTRVHKVLRDAGAVRNKYPKGDNKEMYVTREGTKTTLKGLV